jgi:hypothetical protein
VIGKFMVIFFAWNFYLCLVGYTHIEYKYISALKIV